MEGRSSRNLVRVLVAMLVLLLVAGVQGRGYDPECRKNCENKCKDVKLRELCMEMCLRTDCMPHAAMSNQEALRYCNLGCTASMCTKISSAESSQGCEDSCFKECGKVYALN